MGLIDRIEALKRFAPASMDARFLQQRNLELHMSVIDCLPNVIAGVPALSPEVDDPERDNCATMTQANEICRDLTNGTEMFEIALHCADPMSLGIGVMLAKMRADGLIRDFDHAEGKLKGIFGRESSKGIPLNRRTVIAALQYLRMAPRDMTVRMVKPAGSIPTMDEISRTIEFHTGITLEEIRSASRVREIVNARFLTIWAMRAECGHSLSIIGRRLGDRDHTSILNGVQRLRKKRNADVDMRKMIDHIGDQTDLLALRRNRSDLAASMCLRQNGRTRPGIRNEIVLARISEAEDAHAPLSRIRRAGVAAGGDDFHSRSTRALGAIFPADSPIGRPEPDA